ncbi:MAG: hypothetical protein IJZ25_02295 [Lachnospiraceae bacterium]|nr:hypothetical protein [Lachnospiraceae bacterium]
MEQNSLTIQALFDFQEVLTPETVDFIKIKDKKESLRLGKRFTVYLTLLSLFFSLYVLGFALDGTNIKVTTTTANVITGSNTNDYSADKYSDVILIKDTVGVDAEIIDNIRIMVGFELSYLSDEFVDEFLKNTKFEIEIRDTYCYSQGFGRNYFLHGLDKYNFTNYDGYVRGYYEGDQGILRVHAFIQTEDLSVDIRESLIHELGHYFDTSSFRYSSSAEFMELYEKYSEQEYITIRVVPGYTPDGKFYYLKNTDYPLSEPCELFAEMFQQYVKYPNTVEELYPDIYAYYLDLLGA